MLAQKMAGRLFCSATLIAVVVGCSSPPREPDAFVVYKGYAGPDLPVDQIAVLTCKSYCMAIWNVDDPDNPRKQWWSTVGVWEKETWVEASLLPGEYRLQYGCYKYATSLFDRDLWFERLKTLELEAGHTYVADAACGIYYTSFLTGRRRSDYPEYLWIEDETTGAVVAGRAPSDDED